MKANTDYSRHLSTAGLCIHIVRTKLLCSNLKVRVCISYVPCFIVSMHECYCPTQDSVESDNTSGSSKSQQTSH